MLSVRLATKVHIWNRSYEQVHSIWMLSSFQAMEVYVILFVELVGFGNETMIVSVCYD